MKEFEELETFEPIGNFYGTESKEDYIVGVYPDAPAEGYPEVPGEIIVDRMPIVIRRDGGMVRDLARSGFSVASAEEMIESAKRSERKFRHFIDGCEYKELGTKTARVPYMIVACSDVPQLADLLKKAVEAWKDAQEAGE